MKRNKLLAFVLSLCLTVGLLPSLTANAEVKPSDNKVKVESKATTDSSTTITVNTGDLVTEPISGDALKESKGVKTKAVIVVAEALISRTSWFCDKLEYLGVVDEESAAVIEDYSDEIYDYLEDVAAYADNAAAFVRENLPSKLRSFGIDKGICETIAYGLSYAIKGASWIFG